MWRASSDCTDEYVVARVKSPLRTPTSGSATNATLVNAVSSTVIIVKPHLIGSPTIECENELNAALVSGLWTNARCASFQPAGSVEFFVYQRARLICMPT